VPPRRHRGRRAQPLRQARISRRRSRSPSACAQAACPISQTPPPAETSTCTRALEGSILYRPHSARRCRSARSSIPCPAASLPPARRCTLRASDGANAEALGVHAPARRLRVSRSQDLGAVRRRSSQIPVDRGRERSDPCDPVRAPQAGPAYWQAAAACGIGSGNTVSETRCASRSVWSGRFRWSGRKDTSVARALKSETVAKPLGAYNPMHRGAQKESKWATASIPSA
jgi:hypothetical protein